MKIILYMSYLNFLQPETGEFTEESFEDLLQQAESLETEYFYDGSDEGIFLYMYRGELVMVLDGPKTYLEGGAEAKNALDYL